MGKKKKGPIIKQGLDEWMGTYSDMITLLFCFFVLLYASSTRDETRFQYIFQAFSTGGEYLNTIVGLEPETPREGDGLKNSEIPPVVEEGDGAGADTPRGTGEDPDSFSELFSVLKAAAENSELSESISVEGNSGQIRIRFDNDIMFDADSFKLKESGRRALGLMAPSMKATGSFIASIIIQGHTAKINGVSAVNDWDLSCMRASEVTKYLEFTKTAPTEKLKAEGMGPNVPIDSSETDEARAKNRRVEIVINRKKDIPQSEEVFRSIIKYDYNQDFAEVDEDGNKIDKNFLDPDDVVAGIAGAIDSRYSDRIGGDTQMYQENVGPAANDDMLSVNDSDYITTDESGAAITDEAGGEESTESEETAETAAAEETATADE